MIATNRAVRQARAQVFQSGHAISTPFFNRAASKAELQALFDDPATLAGTAVVISAPFGTGKTFFVETMAPQVGILHRETALRVPDVSRATLKRVRSDVLFLDEADTKSTWRRLDDGLAQIGDELAASGRTAVLLGDYALRNPELLDRLPAYTHIKSFEPPDRYFLQGVVQSRLNVYVAEGRSKVEDVIEPELYDMLAPPGMARVSSLRTILAFLSRVANDLPHDDARCRITLAMARERAAADVDLMFNDVGLSQGQEGFLFKLLDYLAEHHPDGTGLEDGCDAATMMAIGAAVGYRSWEDVADEIIVPFGQMGWLLSRGIPLRDELGTFVRFVEPFFPSLGLMLAAVE